MHFDASNSFNHSASFIWTLWSRIQHHIYYTLLFLKFDMRNVQALKYICTVHRYRVPFYTGTHLLACYIKPIPWCSNTRLCFCRRYSTYTHLIVDVIVIFGSLLVSFWQIYLCVYEISVFEMNKKNCFCCASIFHNKNEEKAKEKKLFGC